MVLNMILIINRYKLTTFLIILKYFNLYGKFNRPNINYLKNYIKILQNINKLLKLYLVMNLLNSNII